MSKENDMERTTREEHSKICEQCSAVERELDRLREKLNEAEDKVRELEVKSFPGRKHLLEEAAQREADARSAYSEAQHKLDEIKRQERLLRMKMRREENGISLDDIPAVATISEVAPITFEAVSERSALFASPEANAPKAAGSPEPEMIATKQSVPLVSTESGESEAAGSPGPNADTSSKPEQSVEPEVQGERRESKSPAQLKKVSKRLDETKKQRKEPTYCMEDHGNFGEDSRRENMNRRAGEGLRESEDSEAGEGLSESEDSEAGEGFRESEEGEDGDGNLAERILERGKKVLEDNKRDWRVIRGTDVDSSQSLRGEIMEQIREIEGPLREIRSQVDSVKVLGAIKATNDLSGLRPKMIRLVHLVDTIREECPQVRCPRVELPQADGFTLLEDVIAKKDDESRISTADEIDRFLAQLPRLKQAIKEMPEREGVRDPLE